MLNPSPHLEGSSATSVSTRMLCGCVLESETATYAQVSTPATNNA